MKGHQITLGIYRGRAVAALVTDGVLEDLLVDVDAPRPGAIYRAKASRPMKGQGGMFFETPEGNAFLRGARGFAPGDTALVQVSGYAEPGKAIPVTDRLLFKSRYAIATAGAPGINVSRSIRDEKVRADLLDLVEPHAKRLETHGLILRSAAQDALTQDIAEDIARVIDTLSLVMADQGSGCEKLIEGPDVAELAWREWPLVTPVEEDIAGFVDQALQVAVPLPGGGRIFVEPTRACVAIDVNTGTDTSPAAGLKANIAASRALPRQLRLKGLGGQIVVDFAPAPKRDRRSIEQALRAAFRADSTETTLLGWTNLGHFELTRKRARPVLHEVFP